MELDLQSQHVLVWGFLLAWIIYLFIAVRSSST